MEASEFSIAPWPRRLMEQEVGAAILYCQLGGKEIDGPERAEALKRTFEYIAEKLCDVSSSSRFASHADLTPTRTS